jgi:peroxiredoxin
MIVGFLGVFAFERTTSVSAQEAAKAEPETLEAIEEAYYQDLQAVELKRLDRIAALAQKKAGIESEDLWRYYFETIVADDLFMKAEANANTLLQKNDLPIDIRFMAEVTHIIAEARRGQLEASLESVRKIFVKARENAAAVEEIPTHLRLGLVEIYLRTIVDAGRYDLANKAIDLILAESVVDEVKEYLNGEKASLARIGKPAPEVKGSDVDGRPFDLAAMKGKPVLIVFWATWDGVSQDQLEEFVNLTESYKDKGLEVVAINVDRLREDAEAPEDIAVDIRRFLIERNLLWKSLICDEGGTDYAKTFGVRYLPSNILIDKQGIIRHVDRSPAGLAKAIAEVCE